MIGWQRARTASAGRRPAVLLIILAVLSAGCAADGRDLAEPLAWQTTTSRPPPTTVAPDREVSDSGLELSSPDFSPGAEIPLNATCDGDNIFPTLEWTGAADTAVELAVSLSDQTDPANPDLLWLMAGIDPSLTGLDAGVLPVGAVETLNGFGNPGYGNPCLMSLTADEPGIGRDLQFRIYVLDQPSGVFPGAEGDASWATIKAMSTDSASILARLTAEA